MDLGRSQKVMLFKFSAYGFLKNLRFFEPLLLLFLTVQKGLSYTEFGLLIGVREVFIWLLEIPTGIVADVTGRRRAMVLAFASYLISFAIFSYAGSFWAFVPAMILFAAGEAFRSGTHKSMIMQHLDLEGLTGQRVHYYGYTRSMSRLGSAVAALGVGVFAFVGIGYDYIFPATMVPYALGLGLMLTYPAELDGATERKKLLSAVWRHTADSFKSLCQTADLKRVVVNESIFDAFFKAAKDYLQPIVKTAALGLPLLAAAGTQERTFLLVGAVYFVVYLNSFFSSRFSGHAADRASDLARALNGLFWAFALGFCLVGTFYGRELAVPAIVVFFFFYTLYNLRKPMAIGYMSDLIPGRQRATVLSVQSQVRAIFAAVVAPLLGWVADQPDLGIPWAFLLGGAALLALGLLVRLRKLPEPAEGGPAA